MAYSIIEAMPSVHSTLIGFVGAFLCAIGVYAMQKIHEASDRLSDVLEKAKLNLVPKNYKPDSIGLVLPDGNLDWTKSSKIMHAAACVSLADEYVDKFYTRSAAADDEVVIAFERLWILLAHVFICYPFNGEIKGLNFSDAAMKLKNKEFDVERMTEVRSRLFKLEWYKKTSGEKVLALARKYSTIQHDRNTQRKIEQVAEGRAVYPKNMTDEELKRMDLSIMHSPANVINGEQVIVDLFGLVDEYSMRFIPVLTNVLSVRDLWSRRLPIKYITKLGGGFSCFILLFGVFLPPVVLSLQTDFDLCVDYKLCWSTWMGYLLYGVAMIPYFGGAWFLWRKFRHSKELH